MADNEAAKGAWSRREVLVGAGVAVAVLGVAAHRMLDASSSANAPDLGPIAAGARIDRWEVIAVHPVRYGAIPIVLATEDGRRYQVDVLARDNEGPAGVANTERSSLYVANQGNGDMATDEEQGLGAIALARVLAQHESAAASMPELLTLRQRNAEHDGASFGVALQ